MRISLLLSFCLCLSVLSYGATKPKNTRLVTDEKVVYPTPPVSPLSLFYVQRNTNTNTIIYDLNYTSDGKLDASEPVKVYWIRYAEDSSRKDLSYIQRKFAYGLTSKALANGNYDIRFVSYKKFPLTLMKTEDGKYHIFALIAQKKVMLNRIFVKINGGTLWLPSVTYVEVKVVYLGIGKERGERFKP